MDMNLNKFQEIVKEREVWHVAVHGVKKSCPYVRYAASHTEVSL